MNLHSINKARFGFAYQYKYALLRILQLFNKGKLIEAYIDFPFSKDNSIDILIKVQNPNEHLVYEIKTGADFVEDKRNELKDSLRTLYTFRETQSKECKMHIIIPEPDIDSFQGFPSNFLQNWNDLLFICRNPNTKNNYNETPQEVSERCYKEFNFNEFCSIQEFKGFVKRIDFKTGPSYSNRNSSDGLSNLEKLIISEIKNLCKTLEIKNYDIEVPCRTIGLELLENILQSIEVNKGIIANGFSLSLCECLSRKAVVSKAKYNENIYNLQKKEKNKIEKSIAKIMSR